MIVPSADTKAISPHSCALKTKVAGTRPGVAIGNQNPVTESVDETERNQPMLEGGANGMIADKQSPDVYGLGRGVEQLDEIIQKWSGSGRELIFI